MIASMVWEDRGGVRPVKYRPGDVIPDDHPRRAWLLRYGIAVVEKPVEPVEPPAAADGDGDADPVESDGDVDPVEPIESDGDVDPVESADDEDDTDPVDPVDENGRPRKTAPVAAWRKYADAQGLPTKGLNKQQIIAALT